MAAKTHRQIYRKDRQDILSGIKGDLICFASLLTSSSEKAIGRFALAFRDELQSHTQRYKKVPSAELRKLVFEMC